MKKHILTAAILCLLVLTLPVSALASSSAFADVPANAYYKPAVSWAVAENITTGTTATTFSPDQTCTRAQILTFLWRAAGSPRYHDQTVRFADVKESDYFYSAACWAAQEGVLGTKSDRFAPSTPCTRAATVEYLWRYYGSPDTAGASFSDVASGSELGKAVSWAVKEGVTNGTSATTFSPDQTCTRGQIVTFLHRAFAGGQPVASGNVTDSDLSSFTVPVTYVDAEDPDNLVWDNLGKLCYDIYVAGEGTVIKHSDLNFVSNNPSENIAHFFKTMKEIDGSVDFNGSSADYGGKPCGTYKVDGNNYYLHFNFMSTKVARNVFLNALNYFGGDMGVSVFRMFREHYFFRSNEEIPISNELAAKYGLTITMLEEGKVSWRAKVSNGMDTWEIKYGCNGAGNFNTFIWIPA